MRTDEQLEEALRRPERTWPGEVAAYERVQRRRTLRMRRTAAGAGLALVAMLGLAVGLRAWPGGWAASQVAPAAPGASVTTLDRAVDCRPPRNERALLAEYKRDPILDFRPLGIEPLSGIDTERACIEPPEWQFVMPDGPPSAAGAGRHMRSVTRVDAALLSSLYVSEAERQGWAPAGPDPTFPYGMTEVRYCKQVRGVTTYLELMPDADPDTKTFVVQIVAYPEDPACRPPR